MSIKAKSSAPVALVTGASRRIGACIAKTLHQRGCDVIIHYHSSESAALGLCERLNRRRTGSSIALQADLTDKQGPESLARKVLEHSPQLAVLVNNASRFYPTPVGAMDYPQWQEIMGSNARAPLFLTQHLRDALRGGAVVNLLDIHARRPMDDHTIYCMAKAALEMMTLSLARELAPEIRVNGVSPGAILWPEQGIDEQAQQAILDRVAMGKPGRPEDIAGAVAWLALDAPYVTGQVLAVDGGRSLNI